MTKRFGRLILFLLTVTYSSLYFCFQIGTHIDKISFSFFFPSRKTKSFKYHHFIVII